MSALKGFSTLELLIAMTILVLALGGVILLAFSNQTVLVDSQLAGESLAKTQEMLEEAQTLSRKDFRLVNPIQPVTDGMFTKTLTVATQPDWFSKKITATVTWTGEFMRSQRTVLSTIVSNFENPVGADTCASELSGDWTDPEVKNATTDFATLAGDAGGYYGISDLDASLDTSVSTNRDRLYVAVNDTGAVSGKTFFTFNITNPASPVLVPDKSIDNDATSDDGINAIHVAGRYAYAASARTGAFNTPPTPCDNLSGTNPSCGQLYVIDLGVTPASLIYTLQVASVEGVGGQGIGKSVFYKDGYVYLGLTKTANGPEFNIIDVHNPTAPFWLSGLSTGATVNNITVRSTVDGTFAFIATPNSTLGGGNDEISVIDVSNPANPVYISGFTGPNNEGNGKVLYAIGDYLYAGETNNTSYPEFFRTDISSPLQFAAKNPYPLTNPSLFSYEAGSSVNGVVVRDFVAFLATTAGQLLTLNISNPASVTQYAPPLSLNGPAAALDCEGNYLYAASNPSGGNLYVIAP